MNELEGFEKPRSPPFTAGAKDVMIVRQTCIKAASEFLAGSDAGERDLLRLAETMEAWVLR